MNPTDPVNRFIEQIASLLPLPLHPLRQELEKNLRQGLQHLFNELDLVSRDEFDIQSKVLEKTRLKLAALEQKLLELENKHL